MGVVKQAEATRPAYRGAGMVTAFLDANDRICLDRVAEQFGMSKLQLAQTIGLAPDRIYRAARLGAARTQARMAEMLEILDRVADWAGGVPSFANGARADMGNLVLWTWGPAYPHRIEVYDPASRLPRGGSSCKAG
jgi:RES domain-containing protein